MWNKPAPPDFVGVGVQKSGTSWWYALIAAHPAFCAGARRKPTGDGKERHFFDRFWAEPFEDRHIRDYHELFARPRGRLGGEWTPRYIFDP